MQALAAVPDVLADLEITLSRAAVTGSPQHGGRTAITGRDHGMPFHEGAATARLALLKTLAVLSSHLSVDTGKPAPTQPQAQARYLAENLAALPADSPALAGVGDITRAVRVARRVVDRPVERRLLGPCGCGATLYGAPEDVVVRCLECGRRQSAAAVRVAAVNSAADRMATAAELARILTSVTSKRVTPEVIRQWSARGKLTARRRGGDTVYRLGDVIALVEALRQ